MTADDDWAAASYPDGITVVPLWERPDGSTVTRDGTPVDLRAEEVPTATAAELLETAVRLDGEDDVDPAALEALRSALPVPEPFEASGWLTGHHALVLTEGRREIGGVTITHHPQRGLEITPIGPGSAD